MCTRQQYLLNQDKSVDSWIDKLDPCETSNLNTIVASQDLTMAWLMQQNLPSIQKPLFNGSPFTWVEFVTKFKDIAHDQSYLNNSQKLHYLSSMLLVRLGVPFMDCQPTKGDITYF